MDTNNNTPTQKKKKNKKKGNKMVILLLVVLALLFFIFNREKKIKEDKPDLNVSNGSGSNSSSGSSDTSGSSGSSSDVGFGSDGAYDFVKQVNFKVLDYNLPIVGDEPRSSIYLSQKKPKIAKFSDYNFDKDINYYNLQLSKMFKKALFRFDDGGLISANFNGFRGGKFYISEIPPIGSLGTSYTLENGSPFIFFEHHNNVYLGILYSDNGNFLRYYQLNVNDIHCIVRNKTITICSVFFEEYSKNDRRYGSQNSFRYYTKDIATIDFETKEKALEFKIFLSKFI